MSPQKLPWRRLAAEFSVIVAGVLVALAADAAWEERDEALRLESYLAGIASDLSATRPGLDEAIARDSLVEESARLLGAAINRTTLPPSGELDQWARGLTRPSLFAPRTGTIQAMIQSGDLRLVRDPELHAAILDYLNAMERLTGLYPNYQLVALEAFGRIGDRVNFETELGPDSNHPDWKDLAREPGLTSDIRLVGTSARIRLGLLGPLRQSHAALEGQLARRR
jgi:hypothetical protein